MTLKCCGVKILQCSFRSLRMLISISFIFWFKSVRSPKSSWISYSIHTKLKIIIHYGTTSAYINLEESKVFNSFFLPLSSQAAITLTQITEYKQVISELLISPRVTSITSLGISIQILWCSTRSCVTVSSPLQIRQREKFL